MVGGLQPLISSNNSTSNESRPALSERNAGRLLDQAAAQDDLTSRRSDSPVLVTARGNNNQLVLLVTTASAAAASGARVVSPTTAGNIAQPLTSTGEGLATGATAGNGNAGVGLNREGASSAGDSITLGQLRAIIAAAPKPKQSVYTFPAPPPDSHTLLNEIEEFFSYVEIPQVLEHKAAFLESWTLPTDFVETPRDQQLEQIRALLENITSSDPDQRFSAARNILYIAQGAFASSTSPEHHLHLILSNVALLREAGALQRVWEAVKGTGLRWEGVSTIPDPDAPQSPSAFSPQDRQEYLEEINSELAIHLAILYFMVEVFRGEEEWSEELMNLEPPMPIYLFNVVAGLREKNAKGYPVKKLLLLLWKSMLATIGGMKDIARVKNFVREVEGLPLDIPDRLPKNKPATKVAPSDYQSFRNEITAKYPSYQPPTLLNVDLDRIAAAAAPTPVRSTFFSDANANSNDGLDESPAPYQQGPGQPPVQGGTPAPTPPASPVVKPKKQQFQTDQTRPFVLPFSAANAGPKSRPRLVPRSIDEASELYKANMRVSTELWQTWKLREEYMEEESGIASAEALAAVTEKAATAEVNKLGGRLSSLAIDEEAGDGGEENEEEEDEEDKMDPLSMLRRLEKSLRMQELEEQDTKKAKVIAQKRADVQRLERVELMYRSVLPQMQSTVIVLLKLLLATVTANPTAAQQQHQADSGNDEAPILGLEDIDILRHREITSKAVSAILILALKWFKTSHVMKFHYLSQLLVDSNCLLLILKMFGLQEVATSVRAKNELEDYNFFRYCFLYGSKNPAPPRPEDSMLAAQPIGAPHVEAKEGDDEIELISDYSWRNFFSVINFVHILQKLTKRKSHRILLLVQYKSSAILKRILKVSHPTLQLYVLKVIKSQVPYCGRKWRQSNMKSITAIYLHCRPDLRDEWLTGADADAEATDSLPHEQALRTLVRFFNTKHYSAYAPLLHRSVIVTADRPMPSRDRPHEDSEGFPPRRSMNSFDSESSYRPTPVFGLSSPQQGPSLGHESLDESLEFGVDELLSPQYQLNEYGELETDPDATRVAWDRLGDILGHYDDVSDSESVGSFGLLDFSHKERGRNDRDESDGSVSEYELEEDSAEKTRSKWERMNPDTITALEEERQATLPSSPRPRRRSSTGPISPALRPVLIDRDDVDEEVISNMGPAPSGPHVGGAPVDEVELVFGE